MMLGSKVIRGQSLVLRRPNGLGAQQQWVRARAQLAVSNKLVLVPTGDGSTAHIGAEVDIPGKIELQPGKLYELGRAEPADLIIPIPTVSGRHAIVRVDLDNTVTVTDLSSTNGTYIDDKELPPMKAAPLTEGAEVIFGDKWLAKFQLTVEADDPAPAPAAAAPEEGA